MTRINLVPPRELSRQHLLAEYRELPRVFTIARKRQGKKSTIFLPPEYTLGKGQVLFFTNKLLFCLIRYQLLIDEARRRGYKVKPVPLHKLTRNIWSLFFDNYTPTRAALALNRKRIKERS